MATVEPNGDTDDSKNCPICFELLRSPKTLPCLHTFCEVCLGLYIVYQDQKHPLKDSFECPVCRSRTSAPDPGKQPSEWAELLPIDEALMVLEDAVRDAGISDIHMCGLCLGEDIDASARKLAVKFCTECDDYLCVECAEFHRKMRVMKSHELTSISETKLAFQSQSRKKTSNTTCPFHDDIQIEYFCKDDDALCCRTCAIVDHRKCQEIVEIRTDARGIKSRGEDAKLLQRFESIKSHIGAIVAKVEVDNCEVQKQLAEIPDKMDNLRQNVNNLIDTVEERILCKMESLKQSGFVNTTKKIDRCAQLSAEIDSYIQELKVVFEKGSEMQIFIIMHKLEHKVQEYANVMKEEHDSARSTVLNFQVDRWFTSIAQLHTQLQLEANEVQTDLPVLPSVEGKVKALRKSEVQCIAEVELNTRSRQMTLYSEAACFPDGKIVLADEANQRLCLFQLFVFKSNLQMQSPVLRVAMVDDQTIAVPLPNQYKITIIGVGTSLTIRKSISTQFQCWNLVALHDGFVAVIVDGDQRVRSRSAFDLEKEPCTRVAQLRNNGTEISSFYHDKLVFSIALNKKKDRIYQTCMDTNGAPFYMKKASAETNSLYCFGVDGTPYFTYNHQDLKTPTGVDVDKDDLVYVCGSRSNNIHQISSDGNLLQIVDCDLLKKPLSISFMANGTEFFVSSKADSKRNTILWFKLQ